MSSAKDSLEAIRRATPAILPSLLMCDFGDLRGEVSRLSDAGCKVLHLDVMDGHFVPNLTYGMPIIAGLRRHTDMPLDVHLMISDPVAYARPVVEAGADMVTFHAEAVRDVAEVVQTYRDLGVAIGVAINPETPISAIGSVIDDIDVALVMSVEAGFGGQAFNPVALEKIAALRSARGDLLIEIDGGIDSTTIGPARQAGCDLFVVGSAIFKHDDYGLAIDSLNGALSC